MVQCQVTHNHISSTYKIHTPDTDSHTYTHAHVLILDMEHEVIKQKKEEEKIEKLYHSTQEGNFNNDDYER